MKWVRVKKTEQTMDEKGYMVFRDVEEWEEVKHVEKAAAVKHAGTAQAKPTGVKKPSEPAKKSTQV